MKQLYILWQYQKWDANRDEKDTKRKTTQRVDQKIKAIRSRTQEWEDKNGYRRGEANRLFR